MYQEAVEEAEDVAGVDVHSEVDSGDIVAAGATGVASIGVDTEDEAVVDTIGLK